MLGIGEHHHHVQHHLSHPLVFATRIDRLVHEIDVDIVLTEVPDDPSEVGDLDNLGVTYLLPKVERSPENTYIDEMEQEGKDVAVEQATVTARNGSHECRMLFIPGQNGDIQPFITNERINDPEHAQRWVKRYASRWWIETEYRSIKQEFLARTSSKDHTLRFYYFVFGVLMYNVWRFTDVLLKATVSRELTTALPVLTAGELADWVAIHLQLGPG